MKILFWTDGFWPRIGGAETQCIQLIDCLQERGHESSVIAQRDHPDFLQEETYRGTPIRRFDFNGLIEKRELQNIRFIKEYLDLVLKEFQPDVIHLNTVTRGSSFVFLLLRQMFNMPVVATIHSPDYEGAILSHVKQICSRVDRICSVGDWVLQQMEKFFPQYKNKFKVICNGLKIPEIDPLPLPFDPPTILLLGRLSIEKGFDTAIKAFSLVKKRGTHAQLVIAGSGPERAFLEHLVNKLGLVDLVRFTGELSREEVPCIINKATLFLVPSHFEPFGLVALEAMQMQRPVIASNVGGLPEIVSHEETGLLVPPEDPEALCNAIQQLLDKPDVAIRMGIKGRMRAMEKFSLEPSVVEYEELYEQLLQRSKFLVSTL
jgi:glycogen(starch) synthase